MLSTVLVHTLSRLAGCVSGNGLTVLIFHRVLANPDPLFPEEMHATRFDALMGWMKRAWKVVPLDTALDRLANGDLEKGSLSITFDDGYADNAEVALPILQAHGLTATFFVAPGFLDGGRMWNDTVIESIRRSRSEKLDVDELDLGDLSLTDDASRRAAIDSLLRGLKHLSFEERAEKVQMISARVGVDLPSDLMMTTAQVCSLAEAGMTIGAHTINHPILATLPLSQAREEIVGSKDWLEGMIGARVRLFAYPNGKPRRDYRAEHVHMVEKAGFDGAVSTAWGAVGSGVDRYQIPRFTPWSSGRLGFGVQLARQLAQRGCETA